ncbi:MAG: rhodanese-like domain-containing protein [Bdellovibrionota bacterium]
MPGRMSVKELETKIKNNERPYMLDVRESFERDICKLEDDVHIPLKDLPNRLDELDKNREIVVYCRSGGRSQQACLFLKEQGFKVINLVGGVLAWSDYIDPSMPKY